MLGRLLGLVLLGLGWVFLRRLRPGRGSSGPSAQSGSARQVLTEGKSVLADTATELKGAAGEARDVVANVVRNTRNSAADKADRLRTATPSPSSRDTVGIPTTEQPADDALLMQDVAPVSTTAGSGGDAPTFATDAMGPDMPLADPMPGEVAGDPDYAATSDTPEPFMGESTAQSETTLTDTGTLPADSQAGETTEATRSGMSSAHGSEAEQPVTSSYITFTSDDEPASTDTREASATTADEPRSDALDTTAGASRTSVDEAQSATDAGSDRSPSAEDTEKAPEGLLIAQEDNSASTSDTDATSVQQSSPDDLDTARSSVEAAETSSADDQQGTRRDPRRIEGGSGERIYSADEPRGVDDTQDTADSVGKPGPVADARREELQSVHITPETGASTADYSSVEVSLPPETLAALESMDEHGPAQTVDYPIEDGYTVEATDGKVGSVSSVVRVEGAVENYMVVKEGLILKKEVNIPFSAVDRIEDDTVYLTIDKQYIKLMEGQETIHTGDTGATL